LPPEYSRLAPSLSLQRKGTLSQSWPATIQIGPTGNGRIEDGLTKMVKVNLKTLIVALGLLQIPPRRTVSHLTKKG
jgi:hypothetical protein